jgi:hypothetical protein
MEGQFSAAVDKKASVDTAAPDGRGEREPPKRRKPARD